MPSGAKLAGHPEENSVRGDCAYCQTVVGGKPLCVGDGGWGGKAQPGAGGQARLKTQ